MKPSQRSLLVAVSCFALTCPVTIQIDIAKSGGMVLEAAPAIAKEGNNGGGRGDGGGNGNGNSGGKGNSGNNGDSGNKGNDGNKGNSGGNAAPGNGGAAGNAGNNGNGRGNGQSGGVGNGNGRSGENANSGRGTSDRSGRASNQGNSANPGRASGQGASGQNHSNAQGKSSDMGRTSGTRAGSTRGANPPASAIAGGLSALFGAISNGLRPLASPPERAADKARNRKSVAKTKSNSGITESRQNSRTGQKGKHQAGSGKAVGRTSEKAVTAHRTPNARPGVPAATVDRSLPKPIRARNSIVAAGLTPTGLARLNAQGFRTEVQTKGTLVSVVRLIPPRGMSLGEAQRRVRVVDAGAAADFDHYYYTDEGSSCVGPSCEAISLIGWNRPASEQCGPAPTIGLIDTGINRDHEALKGQAIEVLDGLDLRGSPSLRDHGTAVAAILVGRSGSSAPGLLPGARLLAVDAFYRDGGTADRTDVLTLVRALEALAERGVRVVNMSLSGSDNEVLKRAIAAAQEKGMIIVAAAGNNGAGAEPSYPAAYPGVIAVTAVDKKLTIYSRATQGEYIDLAAPGVDLWVASADGGGSVKSGTSYAAPFISAAAAILSATSNTFHSTDLQAILESSTLDLGPPGRDKTYGYGLLQAAHLCSLPLEETPIAHSAPERDTELP